MSPRSLMAVSSGLTRLRSAGSPLKSEPFTALSLTSWNASRSPEQISTRLRQRLQLPLVVLDGCCEKVGGQPPVVSADDAQNSRTFGTGRAAIAFNEIALRAQTVRPLCVHVTARGEARVTTNSAIPLRFDYQQTGSCAGSSQGLRPW